MGSLVPSLKLLVLPSTTEDTIRMLIPWPRTLRNLTNTRKHSFSSQERTASTPRDRSMIPPLTSLTMSSKTLHQLSSVFQLPPRPLPTRLSPRRCWPPRLTKNAESREPTRGMTARESLQPRRPRKLSSEDPENEVVHNRLIHFYKVTRRLFRQTMLCLSTFGLIH